MAFIDNTIEVDADVRTVYDAWTSFEDYPAFMDIVERVDLVPDDSMHWVAVVEDDIVEWDADVTEHIQDQSVEWHALDGRETGKVTFDKLGENRTKVHYELDYDPAAWEGEPEVIQALMNERVTNDLEEFKAFIEGDE